MRRIGFVALALFVPACGGGGGGGGDGGLLTAPPAAPFTPQSPGTTSSLQPVWSWSPHPDATSYRLEVSTSDTFGTTLVDAPGLLDLTYSDSNFLDPGATYYWRVTADTPAGPVVGPVASFTVEAAPAVFTSVSGTLREMAFDEERDRVYVANESEDRIEVYDAAGDTLLAPIPVGDAPWGLDLRPDGARLFVCLSGENRLAVVDLTAVPPTVSHVTVSQDMFGTDRPRTIACASNGLAFFTCVYPGSGWARLRQLNMTSLAIAERNDAPLTAPVAFIAASGDRTRLAVTRGGATTEGDCFVYDAGVDSFSAELRLHMTSSAHVGIALDQTGRNIGLPRTRANSDPFYASHLADGVDRRLRAILRPHGTVNGTGDASGMAFAGNHAYLGMVGDPFVEVFDVLRALAVDRVPTGAKLKGFLKADPAGRRLFAVVENGIVEVDLAPNRRPRVERLDPFRVPLGTSAGLTLNAEDVEGDALSWTPLAMPAGSTFHAPTRRLRFSPAAVGRQIALMRVSDGKGETLRPVEVDVRSAGTHPAVAYPIAFDAHEVASSGKRLYASNPWRNRVEVVDLDTNDLLDPLPVGSAPQGLDVLGSRLLVCTAGSEYLDVMDPATGARTTLPVPSYAPYTDTRTPGTVAIASDGSAFFSYQHPYQGLSRRLTELTPANAFIQRADSGPIETRASARANPARGRLFWGSYADTSPPAASLFAYETAGDDFGPVTSLNGVSGVDTDGDWFLALPGPTVYRIVGANFVQEGSFANPSDWGCVRQGGTSAGYRAWGVEEVQEIDLATRTPTGTFPVPVNPNGPMRTDAGGSLLFIASRRSLTVVRLP